MKLGANRKSLGVLICLIGIFGIVVFGNGTTGSSCSAIVAVVGYGLAIFD